MPRKIRKSEVKRVLDMVMEEFHGLKAKYPETSEQTKRPISLDMILERSVEQEEDIDATLDNALNCTHIFLDRRDITKITLLECFTKCTHLYLQNNRITQIENLGFLFGLEFLSLKGNMITEIPENGDFGKLARLAFIDLSENEIEEIPKGKDTWPPSLVELRMEGNPCTCKPHYREKIKENIPLLSILDGSWIGGKIPSPPNGCDETITVSDILNCSAEDVEGLGNTLDGILKRKENRSRELKINTENRKPPDVIADE